MKRRPGTGTAVRQSACVGIGRRQQQQNLGLQRIGVLEFVNEQVGETRLEAAPDRLVAFDQSAGLEQQIEEVECAGAGFQVFVPDRSRPAVPAAAPRRDRRPRRAGTRRDRPGAMSSASMTSRRARHQARSPDRGRAGLGEIPVARQIDEASLEPVVFGAMPAASSRRAPGSPGSDAAPPRCRETGSPCAYDGRSVIAAKACSSSHEPVDVRLTVEGPPRPWRREIAPLR